MDDVKVQTFFAWRVKMNTRDCVNLESIVNYIYESDVELEPAETREYFMNSKYESARTSLNDVFKAIDFDAELLKDMNQGYGGKGAFVFPREDGKVIEDIIKFLWVTQEEI